MLGTLHSLAPAPTRHRVRCTQKEIPSGPLVVGTETNRGDASRLAVGVIAPDRTATQTRSYPQSIWRRLTIYQCNSLDYERSYHLASGYRHYDRRRIWRRNSGHHQPDRAASQRPVFDGIVCTSSSEITFQLTRGVLPEIG